jgi:hypothetical protein
MPRATPTEPPQWPNAIVETGMVDPRTLRANPDNWRLHPDEQRRPLRRSLAKGWVTYGALINERTVELGWAPDEVGEVMVDGHARVEEALGAGQQAVPYTKIRVSPEREAEILATLDPIAALAVGNLEAFERVLDRVGSTDPELEELMAGTADALRVLDDLARDQAGRSDLDPDDPSLDDDGQDEVDHADELRQKWGVAAGQLWVIPSLSMHGRAHRLVCGDSRDPEVARRAVGGMRAVLMATDPPYNLSIDYGAGVDDAKTAEAYQDFTLAWVRAWAPRVDRALVTPGGHNLVLWLTTVCERAGVTVKHVAPWIKRNATSHGYVTRFWCWEPVLFLDCAPEVAWPRERHDDVFDFPIGQQHAEGMGSLTGYHPCPRSMRMWVDVLEHYAAPLDLVAEPFSGSGTTLVAGEKTGRQVVAAELEPKYVAVGLERLAKLGLEPRLADG